MKKNLILALLLSLTSLTSFSRGYEMFPCDTSFKQLMGNIIGGIAPIAIVHIAAPKHKAGKYAATAVALSNIFYQAEAYYQDYDEFYYCKSSLLGAAYEGAITFLLASGVAITAIVVGNTAFGS